MPLLSKLTGIVLAHHSNLQTFLVTLLILTGAIFLFLLELLRPVDKQKAPLGKNWRLPPGPRGYPIVGNLFFYLKGEKAALNLAKYGEMTTTHLGSKLWVLLNSDRVAIELYNRKSSVTNGRPWYPIVSDLISLNNRSVLLPANEWAERRRVMHQLLSGTALVRYQDYQNEESMRLLVSYLKSPEGWHIHHRRYSNSVIHRITFGERPRDNDSKVEAVAYAQKVFLLNGPPMNVIDCFPELAKLPRLLHFWRKKYEALGQITLDAYSAYWIPIKKAIEEGKAPPSFARDVLTGEGGYKGSDINSMFLAMQLVEAGSDTTRLTLNMFVLAATTQRDKYLKARAEVDAVCGADAKRLPGFNDESSLPYVGAFAKELLRWRPIFIWTPEHTLTENFEFEGYFFPKGTHFMINHASISSNPDSYDEPEAFKPERWLDGHETELTQGVWQFGGGRRVCVGHRLAQKSLFINLARLIQCFDYKERAPFDSNHINHFVEGEPFPVLPSIRSQAHADLIAKSATSMSLAL